MIQLWLGFVEIKGALFAFVRAEVTNASGEPPRGKSSPTGNHMGNLWWIIT